MTTRIHSKVLKKVLKALPALALAGGGLLVFATACAVSVPEERIAAIENKVGALEKAKPAAAAPGEREFVVTGYEIKGSTSTKDLAAPTADPAKLSDGYRYKEPGKADASDATKWEVSTYRFEPGVMVALQGDKITLRVFIINGDKHTSWIEGPDRKEVLKEQVWNRGREYKVSFTAEKAGAYKLHCNEHDPTMHSTILVLPQPS